MTVLWGKGNIHDRTRVVRASLAAHPDVVTERFPSYAPETDPDGSVWQHTKHGPLADVAPEETAGPWSGMIREFVRLHEGPEQLSAFIRHAEVPIRLRW